MSNQHSRGKALQVMQHKRSFSYLLTIGSRQGPLTDLNTPLSKFLPSFNVLLMPEDGDNVSRSCLLMTIKQN